ncbi:MAG: pyruvate:ferredoxin (flavodoxin) oxidoreductase [Dactylosporangium sp.]|nr:pyruvate:ferredoxin (flavodoxin) oxidoreductase [Dactylosporangium sp.]NNJ63275.1 pyruvate:ferredoxin (flavodoxin) oxidoreductase [Dactylosporangium sp.]
MKQTTATWATVDGNEAVAKVAHALSEVIAIYPITPASPMGEFSDAYSAAGTKNLWGSVPEVVEMQSEAGAAGMLHGALQKGALATTFTASQGLLLMLPNMYKIAGELTPTVIHVAARTLATHALSIFGDHSDVMSARSTGWTMLAADSVQQAHDFTLLAHAASLRTRVPVLHFFDGFRTSHEVDKIQLLPDTALRALISDDDVLAHRMRGLSPDRPVLRGSAQNPDVFFQAREAANTFYDAVPEAVQDLMDQMAAQTGRAYRLVEYTGAPDAERIILIMGSGAGAALEAVEEMARRGERVGMINVHLYRPLPAKQLIDAIPATVRRITVLDRTKEPGAGGEPLYLDTVTALAEAGRGSIEVFGARYGLSSKEFTPQMVKGVFDELALPEPRRHTTVGIRDDVTHLSVAPDPDFIVPTGAVQAVFYGLGSDGTVGANKATIKIIGEHTDLHAQGYFVYDSRKAGSTTVSHLRFGPDQIRSTYLIDQADFVGVHQFSLLQRMKIIDIARPGATVLFNSPFPADQVWSRLSTDVQQQIIDKKLHCYTIDAHRIAREVGLGTRINTVMQPCFFKLADILPFDEAIAALKANIKKAYGKRGASIVERNYAAVDQALAALVEVPVPATVSAEIDLLATLPSPADMPDFVERFTSRVIAGEGDLLPVSAMPIDGTFPTGTAKFDPRSLAQELPIWDPSLCTDCGKCAIVCPHAAIRIKVYDPAELAQAPEGFQSKDYRGREYKGQKLTVQVAPDDCTGCGICVEMCPAASRTDPKHKSINMLPAAEHRPLERPHWGFFGGLPEIDRTTVRLNTVKGSQLLQPLFEFSGACSGCGETPYVKLLSQLFGDRLVIANATGCSSIYGGNLPTTPYTTDAAGRGPAWANSLFEDNAEFGLGLRVGYENLAAEARRQLTELAPAIGGELVGTILEADQSDEAGLAAQRARVAELKDVLAGLASGNHEAKRLLSIADELVKRSVWILGGDGWAYDIGFGGLDHILATGRNVNIMVLDTEVYSNTGGQASKATPVGAVAKFAAGGKATGKKDLGAIARSYGNVYVAQIALGANEMQTVRAIAEAEAWDGPSLVIAYGTCIEHGIDMTSSMGQQKSAVASGYWPLYRYQPDPEASAKAFQLDSKKPTLPVADFMKSESRFTVLARSNPERAEEVAAIAQADINERWRYLEELARQERSSGDA